VDVTLINSAKREIDFAAYVLTDWPVTQALTRWKACGRRVPRTPAGLYATTLALGLRTCPRQSRRHKLTVSIDDLDNSPARWLDENHLVVDHRVAIFRWHTEFARNRVKRDTLRR